MVAQTDVPGIDLLALESQVCFALAVASRRVIGMYRPLLEPMGLTHPQYLVMLALWQNEPLSMRRIGELLSLEPATLSPLLKRLEAAGYIDRTRSLQDERLLNVTLTPKGRALRERAVAIPPTIMRQLGLEIDELRTIHATLRDIARRAEVVEFGSE